MVKIIFLIAGLVLAFCGSSTSTNIECIFNSNDNYNVLGSIYQCSVNNNKNIIKEESAQLNGTHESSKSNDNLLGFSAESKTVQIFPKSYRQLAKIEYLENLIINAQNIIFEELKSNLNVGNQYGNFSKFETKVKFEDTITTFDTKLEKIQNFEEHFVKFKAAMRDKFKILKELGDKFKLTEKKLTKKLRKMSTNFDKKIYGFQKDLTQMFEEILKKKMDKLFMENFGVF